MAIAFVGAANLGADSTTSQTVSYTVGAGSNLLVVVIRIDSATDTVTGVTYNGVSLTEATNVLRGARQYLWYLLGPATGANNIVISKSGTSATTSCAGDYSGVAQSGQPDATGTQSNTGASVTATLTTVADNCWLIGAPSGYNSNEEWSAGSGTTRRASDTSFGTTGLFDSNSATTPAGSDSLVMTHSADPFSLGSAAVVVSFAPAAGNVTVSAGKGALTLTGYAPLLTQIIRVLPGKGAAVLTGYAPTLTQVIRVLPGKGALTLAGYEPTISFTQNTLVRAGLGSLVLTGYAPSLSLTGHLIIKPGLGSLVLSGFSPTISLSGNQLIAAGKGALVLTGYEPSLLVTGHYIVKPDTGHLTFSSAAPSVGLGPLTLQPGTGQLVLSGKVPVILTGEEAELLLTLLLLGVGE